MESLQNSCSRVGLPARASLPLGRSHRDPFRKRHKQRQLQKPSSSFCSVWSSDNAGGCTWSSETYHTTLELNHHAHSVSHRERATARSELSPQPMQFGTSVPSLGPSRKIQSSSPAGRSRRPDAPLTSANVVACEPMGRASSAARSAVTEVDFRVARAKRQRWLSPSAGREFQLPNGRWQPPPPPPAGSPTAPRVQGGSWSVPCIHMVIVTSRGAMRVGELAAGPHQTCHQTEANPAIPTHSRRYSSTKTRNRLNLSVPTPPKYPSDVYPSLQPTDSAFKVTY